MLYEVITNPIDKKNLQAVKAGLEAAVNEPGGTAWSRRLEKIKVAGKTGTAQVVKLKDKDSKDNDEGKIPYKFRDHALFVAYAPADNPEVVITSYSIHYTKLYERAVAISSWRF